MKFSSKLAPKILQRLLKPLKCEFHTDNCSIHKLLNVAKLSSVHSKLSVFRFVERK